MALYSVRSARNGARHILTLRFCAADEEIRRGIVSGVSVRQLEEIDHTVSGVVFRAWSKEDNLLYSGRCVPCDSQWKEADRIHVVPIGTPPGRKKRKLSRSRIPGRSTTEPIFAREGISSPPGYTISQARLPDTTIPHKSTKNLRNENLG